MTPPVPTPALGPRTALPPPPPAPAGRTAASEPPRPPRGGSFFPRSPASSYNARHMRPFDSLTRHASSWGWLVTVSAFSLLTAGLVMVVWWAATTEERTTTHPLRRPAKRAAPPIDA